MTAAPAAELHAHSTYSLLDGADTPAALVAEAARLGLSALAVTDHDSLAAAPHLAQAARSSGVDTVFGAELNLDLPATRTGLPDPPGPHLLLLARSAAGYRRLSAAISEANLHGGAKGHPVYLLDELTESLSGHVEVLTGCRKGSVPAALARGGPAAADTALRELIDRFGREHVHVELTRHDQPGDDARCAALAELAKRLHLPTLATNNVHYARPAAFRTYAALAALRARRTLDQLDSWLPAGPVAYLRDPADTARRFKRYPGAVEHAAALAAACALDFERDIRPAPPRFPVPEGYPDEDAYLRTLIEEGLQRRYGTRAARPDAWAQAEHELGLVRELGFAGFFLIPWDAVRFARAQDPPILAQGRGSAANSVIVYALGISAVDPLRYGLLFERFLHADRGQPPDIDIDFAADRREEVIQYLYERFGRRNCAMVANEITMAPRMAAREAARALGYSPGTVDALAGRIDSHEPLPDSDAALPQAVLDLARDLWAGGSRVRHLGIHSGGVVLCDGPISDVLPVEWATMPGRTVVQADKIGIKYAGLYKTDCLSLRALDVIADVLVMLRDQPGAPRELADFPADDDAVYDMLNDGDAVSVFNAESRAQVAVAGPMRARSFRDIAIQLALIRPGPGGSGASRAYLARRNGREPVPRVHPIVDAITAKTLGTVIYQEQVMSIAIDAAGFTAAEADRLRTAMGGAKGAGSEFAALRERFFAGMAERGITGTRAEGVWAQIEGFSGYSFPESHSLSFAFIALAMAWIKKYEPARLLAAMLNHQPMGFYDAPTLIEDAQRHHISVLPVCVNASDANARVDPLTEQMIAAYRPVHPHASPHPQPPVRLGLAAVRSVGAESAKRIVAERAAEGPYTGVEDLARRTELPLPALEALALSGALDCFGLERRAALWAVGAAAGSRRGHLPGTAVGVDPPPLAALTAEELTFAELWSGPGSGTHPIQLMRERLDAAGVTVAADLPSLRDGAAVRVAGLVTHRQRPPTAHGTCFLGLSEETGLLNVIVPAKLWAGLPRSTADAGALLIYGTVENDQGSISILAGRLTPLVVGGAPDRSRSFR